MAAKLNCPPMLVHVIPPEARPKTEYAVPTEPYYPETDGQPMGESDWHRNAILNLLIALELHFAARPDVYVAGNMLLYYQQGEPTHFVSPDVFVVLGTERRPRASYFLWREGRAPSIVFEITSPRTEMNDRGLKMGLYQAMAVDEYVMFDPRGDYLRPPLQGLRLVDGAYRPIEPAAEGALVSQQLGLELVPDAGLLRLRDPRSGTVVPIPGEQAEALRAAETEIARLRAELERRPRA